MTAEQRVVLAMVVLDPDAWIANAINVFGTVRADENLVKKVAKYQAQYDAAISVGTYKTREQLQTEHEASPAYLAEKAAMTAQIIAQQAKARAIIDNLPSWSAISGKYATILANITAATNWAQAKPALIELIKVCEKSDRITYWLAKNTEL